ncbi:hypothetical protein DL770_010828 [Monosporascus sp. CRB-9-2]|nr:hypothetical protein DL770_010828 [Monosporascus sp. CRB-9-2]
MPPYVITGIQAGVTDDTVPLRLEVDSWYPGQTEPHLLQNNLFLWALHFLEAKDPDEKLSYFQIAGIHGSPFMPWDEDTDAQTVNEGYCTHDSLLFPCWHRPYMLLFEQVLYEVMTSEVIPKLPLDKQQEWLDAAQTFRLPYWDWAEKKKRGGSDIYDVPVITKDPRIEVVNLNDGTTPVFIDNPMYKFKMPNDERMGCSGVSDVQDKIMSAGVETILTMPFSKSRATSRWAPYERESSTVSTQWQNGEIDNQKIADALKNHDCNVDRQFAIWQALNVDNTANWFQNSDEQLPDDGTWSIKAATIDTPETPLAPFHKDTEGKYFISDDIKDWMKWGYSYPELQPWLDKYKTDGKFNKKLYIEDIKRQLKELYSPNELKNVTADVIVNVEYMRFALNGAPYTLYFFLGPRNEQDEYRGPLHMHPNLVGFVYTFTNPIYRNRAAPGCANCRRRAAEGTKSRAQVPITGALLALTRKASSDDLTWITNPSAVESHLEQNLYWRARTHGGRDVPIPNDVPFIQVSVYHRKASFDDIASGETYRLLERATLGKPGGRPGI